MLIGTYRVQEENKGDADAGRTQGNLMKTFAKKNWAGWTALNAVTAIFVVAGLSVLGQSARADGAGNADVVTGVGCMQDIAGFGLNCTANDVLCSSATNIVIIDDPVHLPGDTVTFTADFESASDGAGPP